MTDQMRDQPSATTQSSSTPQAAKDKAAELGQAAGERGGQVAGTVAEEAKHVATQARREARDLMDEGLGQLREQAKDGQQKAAKSLRAVADQLDRMAGKAEEPSVATDVVQEVSERARGVASWLESREPGDLLGEVRGFARRRPGVFLAGAAFAGVLAGRLTRGVVAQAKHDSDTSASDARPAPSGELGASGTYGTAPQGIPASREPQELAPPVTPPLPQPTTPSAAPLPGTLPYDREGQVRP
jgi:hypothetical protein